MTTNNIKDDLEPSLRNAVRIILISMNSVGFVIAAMIPISYFYIRSKTKGIMDRVYIRQMVAISLLNILRTLMFILLSATNIKARTCQILYDFVHFTGLASVIIGFTIFLHLQIVIVHQVHFAKRLEPLYYIISCVVGAVPEIIAIAQEGRNDPIDYVCDWDPQDLYDHYGKIWYQFYAWVLLFIILMLICIIVIVVWVMKENQRMSNMLSQHIHAATGNSSDTTLNRNSNRFSKFFFGIRSYKRDSLGTDSSFKNSVVIKILKRYIWIPGAFLLCQGWAIGAYTTLYAKRETLGWVFIVASVLSSIQAPLVSMGYYFDISVIAGFKKVYHQFLNKWYYGPLVRCHMRKLSETNQQGIRQRVQSMVTSVGCIEHISGSYNDMLTLKIIGESLLNLESQAEEQKLQLDLPDHDKKAIPLNECTNESNIPEEPPSTPSQLAGSDMSSQATIANINKLGPPPFSSIKSRIMYSICCLLVAFKKEKTASQTDPAA